MREATMTSRTLPVTLLGLCLLVACASGPKAQHYIGTARMLADRSIEQELVMRADDRALTQVHIVLRPGDPAWREAVQQVGGLKPGEMKAVPADAAS
jgi:hypothetical protein